MDASAPTRDDVEHLVVLAEQIEQDSHAGRGVTAPLHELHHAIVELAAVEPRDVERLLRVVEQLSRDLRGGRVRSISGLAGETRRLGRQLGGPNGRGGVSAEY